MGQYRMGNSRTLRHHRRHFVKCIAITALIFLVTSAGAAQAMPPAQSDVPLADLQKYSGLLTAFGELLKKVQNTVQFPPPRAQSHLLPLLPESTIFYAALPNYGDASHQAQEIFEQEIKESPELRAWLEHGDVAANRQKVEDALEKFYQLSQYLGDEIVVSGTTGGGKDPSLLILAEVRKPGLKDFLQQKAKELAGDSDTPVRLLDVHELATAKDTHPAKQLLILVRPEIVAVALDLAPLRALNARLEKNSRAFASTPFGRRVAQSYEGGTTVVAAADLQQILRQVQPDINQSKEMFQQTGFADAKYLVWEHKTVDGQAASQMELSFTGPRHGVASWLAAPGPLGSLDFVSPKAIMVGAVRLKDPAQIFEEAKDLATASNPNAFAALAQVEQGLKLSLKDDLLGRLSGEIAYEVDDLTPVPVWKVILGVNDPDRLQTTLAALLANMHLAARSSENGGVTYYTLEVPSAQKTTEISYAFADRYLVAGSSREMVTDAIRLHHTGDSLAQSKKFLASLPPGHSSEVSALFYQDPLKVAALSMRQVSPELAESLSHSSTETPPAVICAYGEESALREASRSGGVDASAILVVAAIAIPNLLRARMAANEASAVSNIRTANTAQIIYSSSYPDRGFARDLASLGPDPRGPRSPSADHASVIDATLGNASCTAGAWCTKSGYQFSITARCKKTCDEFVVVGTPVNFNSGTRSFCSTSDAVVRFKAGPPLTSPISASECQTWPPLQ
jgi:hypothetical protein